MEITLTSFATILLALFFFSFVVPSLSSDPDPLQDFCVADLNASISINGFPCKPPEKVTSEDFFFSGFKAPINTSNPNRLGFITANVLTFPGLNTLGLSMVLIEFEPDGINPPHVHPRATEAGVILEGTLLVGFVTTGNVFYSKVLTAGEMFVIPRALDHFQLNIGKERVRMLVSFNSQLPGVANIPDNLFGSNPPIPNRVLTRAFRTNDNIVNSIKAQFRRWSVIDSFKAWDGNVNYYKNI